MENNESVDTVEVKESKENENKEPFIVNAHILERIIPISVGNGSQTFKWLAINVTERYRQDVFIKIFKNSKI